MLSFTLFCFVMVGQVMCQALEVRNNNRIVQGQEASEGQFPYQISITYYDTYFYCSGSIINENYIVTAARCVDFVEDPSIMTVRAGSIYRTNGTVIPIAEVVLHPRYDPTTLDNDVALLKANFSIEFTEYIKPINLPSEGADVTGEVTVSGWGQIQENNTMVPLKLLYVNLTVVDLGLCDSVYEHITENMWCGGDFDMGGPAACRGDSGGPGVQDGILFGIVSWGGTCGAPEHPTVFSNVASISIQDFINDEIVNN